MPKKHAKLSASGAHRWLNCPKSVALEANFPDTTSEFAKEGTLAHKVAEKTLKKRLAKNNNNQEKEMGEMQNYVNGYANYCMDLLIQSQILHKDPLALTEERLNFSKWVPKGFGTGDFVLVDEEKALIVDLKYGKGVKVDAENNPQLRLYGLGVVSEYGWIYPFSSVQMHIYQPRINNVSVETLSRKDLEIWGRDYVKPRARLAMRDEGEFVAGDHCRFCKAREVCKARAAAMLDQIKNIFSIGGYSMLELKEFKNEEFNLKLNNTLFLNYYEDEYGFYCDYEELDIHSYGATLDELKDSFNEDFIIAWELYVECAEEQLTQDAKELRKKLLSLAKRN